MVLLYYKNRKRFRSYIVKILVDTTYSSERDDRNRESTDMCYTCI